jgi:hypothetical protein
LQLELISGQWRLFVYSSKVSFKVVFFTMAILPFYPTESCSSHDGNVGEHSGFVARNTV